MIGKQIIGVLGSALLLGSIFTPFAKVPMVGGLTLFHDGKEAGIIIAGLAVLSLVFALKKLFKLLIVTGVLSLGVLGYVLYRFTDKMQGVESDIQRQLKDSVFEPFGDLVMQGASLDWGWIAVAACAVLTMLPGLLPSKR